MNAWYTVYMNFFIIVNFYIITHFYRSTSKFSVVIYFRFDNFAFTCEVILIVIPNKGWSLLSFNCIDLKSITDDFYATIHFYPDKKSMILFDIFVSFPIYTFFTLSQFHLHWWSFCFIICLLELWWPGRNGVDFQLSSNPVAERRMALVR